MYILTNYLNIKYLIFINDLALIALIGVILFCDVSPFPYNWIVLFIILFQTILLIVLYKTRKSHQKSNLEFCVLKKWIFSKWDWILWGGFIFIMVIVIYSGEFFHSFIPGNEELTKTDSLAWINPILMIFWALTSVKQNLYSNYTFKIEEDVIKVYEDEKFIFQLYKDSLYKMNFQDGTIEFYDLQEKSFYRMSGIKLNTSEFESLKNWAIENT